MASEMKISRLGDQEIKSQLSVLFNLDQNNFPLPWAEQDWQNINEKNNYQLYICKLDSQIIGFALFSLNNLMEQVHLLKIAISSQYRGFHYGERLLTHCLNDYFAGEYRSCYLEVSVANTQAISLYRKLGFHVLVTKHNFYSNGEDAYAMHLVHNNTCHSP